MSQQKQPSGPSSSVQGSPSPSSKSNILNVISSTSDSLQSSSAVQVNATAMSTIMPLKENEDVQEIFTTERTGLEVNTALRDRYAPYLEKTNLYRCLSKKGQQTVLANIKERGFRRNDVILKQHDAAAAMYIIMQGEASVHVSKTPSFQLALNVDAVDASISKNANSMTPTLSKMLSKSYSSADRKKEKSSLPMRRASNLHQSRTNPNSPHSPLKSDQRKSSLGSIDVPNAMGGMRARYGHIVKTCCPGSIFGEKSVLEEAATRSATIIALSDVVRCLVVDKSTIDNVAAQCDFLRDPLTLDDSRPISASLLTADEQKATRISEEMALKLEEIEDHIAAYFGDSSIDDAFLLEDDDGNQYLDYLEFKRLIKEKVRIQISDAEFLNLMNIYDENADGVISLVEFKLKYRVKKAEFLDFIALKQDEADRFGSLPAIVLFFGVYVVLCNARENTPAMYQVNEFLHSLFTARRTTTNEIAYMDIQTIPDLIEWIHEILITSTYTFDIPGHPETIDSFTLLLGSGLRFGLERSVETECAIPLKGNHACYPQYNFTAESFGLRLCSDEEATGPIANITPDAYPAADCYIPPGDDIVNLTLNSNEGFESFPSQWGFGGSSDIYTFYLDFQQPEETLHQRIDYLQNRGWLDNQASFLTIQSAVLNGELGIYNQMEFIFTFSRNGGVIPDPYWSFEGIFIDPYGEPGWGIFVYVLEALWVVMIAILIISEIGEMKEFCLERSRKRSCCAAYCSGYWGGTEGLWNLIDWSQVIITLFNSAYWFYIVTLTRTIADSAFNLDWSNFNASAYDEVADNITHTLDLVYTYRILAFLNLYILMLRFFKSFLGNPKLALVTKTFKNVGADFVHWFIVFLCLLVCFTFAGMVWFGRTTFQFSSIVQTFSGEMNTLARGFVIWLDVAAGDAGNFWIAFMWWFFFMFVMYLCILNVLVVLVLQTFENTKNEMRSKTTICAQISQIMWLQRLKQAGGITLDDIEESIDDNDNDKPDPDAGCCFTCCLKLEKDDDDNENANGIPLSERKMITMSDIFDEFWNSKLVSEKQDKAADNEPNEDDEAEIQDKEALKTISYEYLVSLVDEFFVFRRLNDPTAEQDNEKATWEIVNSLGGRFADLQKQLNLIGTVMDNMSKKSVLSDKKDSEDRSDCIRDADLSF